MRADRIDVVLAEGSSATERLDASGGVTLRLGAKRGSSQRLTYVASEQRYELGGHGGGSRSASSRGAVQPRARR